MLEPDQRLFVGMMIQPEEVFEALILGEALFGELYISIESSNGLRLQIGRAKDGNAGQQQQKIETAHSFNIGEMNLAAEPCVFRV